MHIILLEDDVNQADIISKWITQQGHDCEIHCESKSFETSMRKTEHDVVVLNQIMQSGQSGTDILDWIRNTLRCNTPAVVIMSLCSEQHILQTLQAGASDFLTKPIQQQELLERLSALSIQQGQATSDVVDYSPYTLDRNSRTIFLNGAPLKLTDKEFEFAQFLFLNNGRVVSRDALRKSIWGKSSDINTRTVDTYASHLRQKLKILESESWSLKSLYRHGYRLQRHASHT